MKTKLSQFSTKRKHEIIPNKRVNTKSFQTNSRPRVSHKSEWMTSDLEKTDGVEWMTSNLEKTDGVQCDVSQNQLQSEIFSEKIYDDNHFSMEILQNPEPTQIVTENNESHQLPREVDEPPSENSRPPIELGSSYEERYFDLGRNSIRPGSSTVAIQHTNSLSSRDNLCMES